MDTPETKTPAPINLEKNDDLFGVEKKPSSLSQTKKSPFPFILGLSVLVLLLMSGVWFVSKDDPEANSVDLQANFENISDEIIATEPLSSPEERNDEREASLKKIAQLIEIFRWENNQVPTPAELTSLLTEMDDFDYAMTLTHDPIEGEFTKENEAFSYVYAYYPDDSVYILSAQMEDENSPLLSIGASTLKYPDYRSVDLDHVIQLSTLALSSSN